MADDEDKVFIPENTEESDSESDSFGERLRKLNDEGQNSKQSDKQEHLWFVEMNDGNPAIYEKGADGPRKEVTLKDLNADGLPQVSSVGKQSESPEIFITDYNIIHTQESQALNEDVPMDEVIPQEM